MKLSSSLGRYPLLALAFALLALLLIVPLVTYPLVMRSRSHEATSPES
jgi:hypothetical protein